MGIKFNRFSNRNYYLLNNFARKAQAQAQQEKQIETSGPKKDDAIQIGAQSSDIISIYNKAFLHFKKPDFYINPIVEGEKHILPIPEYRISPIEDEPVFSVKPIEDEPEFSISPIELEPDITIDDGFES